MCVWQSADSKLSVAEVVINSFTALKPKNNWVFFSDPTRALTSAGARLTRSQLAPDSAGGQRERGRPVTD